MPRFPVPEGRRRRAGSARRSGRGCAAASRTACRTATRSRPSTRCQPSMIAPQSIIDGWHADAAITVPMGEIDKESQRLMDVTGLARSDQRRSDPTPGSVIWAPRSSARHGRRLLGRAGVRRARHRYRNARGPEIPNYGPRGPGPALREGMVLAIEPMVNTGQRPRHRTLDDGWTVVTADGTRSAHFEHTVAITDDGPEVLTVRVTGGVDGPILGTPSGRLPPVWRAWLARVAFEVRHHALTRW